MNRISKKTVLELIGKETILKFIYYNEGCFYYETLLPIIPHKDSDEDIYVYGVGVYCKGGTFLNAYESLKDIVRRNHLLEVKKLYEDSRVNIEIYFEKYK